MTPSSPRRRAVAQAAAAGCVVDASVTMAWFFPDEANAFTESLLDALGTRPFWVPALWVLECTNVLQTSCRRGRISSERRAEIARELHDLPVQVDHDLPGFPALDALAAATGLSAYDAAYLELAVRKQLPIASQDAALVRAARASGLKVLKTLAA